MRVNENFKTINFVIFLLGQLLLWADIELLFKSKLLKKLLYT